MSDGLAPGYRESIVSVCSANPRVNRLVLFGSRATGHHRPASDVDLALFGDDLTLDDLGRLAAALESLPIPQRVDLLLFHLITHPALREEILAHGVEWFSRG